MNVERFGKQVGRNNWLFQRDALMAYYEDLMNHPQRLLQVFDSMRPIYNDKGGITGYELNIEGEEEFFSAVGFREGDIVRRVNSLPMTNRNRAEAFIRQFVESDLNVFVFDIEREGRPQRLVYRIR